MHAQSNDGKKYIYILELHKGITDENVRDSVPELKIAALENSEINWNWILAKGYMPIVKHSPTITKRCLNDYYFTPEFWACNCTFDWLHAAHYQCPTCEALSFYHDDHGPMLKFTTDIWGPGPFSDIHTSVIKAMEFVHKFNNVNVLEGMKIVYKHLKAYEFNWVKAYSIENF